jgi:hypothetical protein
MDTVENKKRLWDTCSQLGLFNNIPQGFQQNILNLFDSNIAKFSTNQFTDINVSNNYFLEEFKRDLGKLLGSNADTTSVFEKKQQEYREMFQQQVPAPIDFSTEKDKPIEGDIQEILRVKEDERKLEMSKILGQQPPPLTNVNESSNNINTINSINNMFSFPQQNTQTNQSNQHNPFSYQNAFPPQPNQSSQFNQSIQSTQTLKILEKQSIILMKLLESQVKIIELLQKK